MNGYVKHNSDGTVEEIDSIDGIPDTPIFKDQDFREACETAPNDTFYGDVIDLAVDENNKPIL